VLHSSQITYFNYNSYITVKQRLYFVWSDLQDSAWTLQ